MYGLETNELMVFKENNKAFVLDKISHNNFRLSTNLELNNIVEHPNLKKTINKFRGKPYGNSNECITTVFLSITDVCNFHCYYCSAQCNDYKNNKNYQMDYFQYVEKVIPFLRHIKPQKIIVTGGEPCLHPDFDRIIMQLKERVCSKILIQTNGYYLWDRMKIVSKHVDSVNISCNAYFENGVSLEKLSFLGVGDCKKYTLSYVVNENNRSKLIDFVSYAAIRNLKILVNFMTPLGNAAMLNDIVIPDEERALIYKDIANKVIEYPYANMTADFFQNYLEYRDHCEAAKEKIAIMANGQVYLCQCMSEQSNYIGNIFCDEIEEIAQNHKKLTNSIFVWNLFNVEADQKCNKCLYRYFCGGLCYAVRFYNKKPIYSCKFNKKMIRYLMFYKIQDPMENLKRMSEYLEKHED